MRFTGHGAITTVDNARAGVKLVESTVHGMETLRTR
jgi:hypothetical protein